MDEKVLAELRNHINGIAAELEVAVIVEPVDSFPKDPQGSVRLNVSVSRDSSGIHRASEGDNILVERERDIEATVGRRVRALVKGLSML
jgi:hypothetical protein